MQLKKILFYGRKLHEEKLEMKVGLLYAACVLISFAMGYIYGIALVSKIILMIIGGLFLPSMYLYTLISKYEERRFNDVTSYMQQFISSYKRSHNVAEALQDCAMSFEEGSDMRILLDEALEIRRTGAGVELKEDIAREAFRKIEDAYPSKRLKMLHDFITKAEKMGGDMDRALDILLEDLQAWSTRVSVFQKKRKSAQIEVYISCAMTFGICSVSRFLMLNSLDLDMAGELIYQVCALLCSIAFIGIFVGSTRKIAKEWLDVDQNSEKHVRMMNRRYDLVTNFTIAKNIQESIVPLIIGGILSCGLILLAVFALSGGLKSAAIAGAVGLFGFFVYSCANRKKNFAKSIVRELEMEFPFWILSVSLMLQSESVYNALRLSSKDLTGPFKTEVDALLEKFYENPQSLTPFVDFFKGFEINRIRMSMKVLHAVNLNGYDNMEQQLNFLTKENNQLMDVSETIRYNNQIAGMSMYKFLPMLVGVVKLALDLVVTMSLIMSSAGSLIS